MKKNSSDSSSSQSRFEVGPGLEAKSFNRPNSALFSVASKEGNKDAKTEVKSSNFNPHLSDIQNIEDDVFQKRIKIMLKGGGIAEFASEDKSSLNR
jgi:hypothetical protein